MQPHAWTSRFSGFSEELCRRDNPTVRNILEKREGSCESQEVLFTFKCITLVAGNPGLAHICSHWRRGMIFGKTSWNYEDPFVSHRPLERILGKLPFASITDLINKVLSYIWLRRTGGICLSPVSGVFRFLSDGVLVQGLFLQGFPLFPSSIVGH